MSQSNMLNMQNTHPKKNPPFLFGMNRIKRNIWPAKQTHMRLRLVLVLCTNAGDFLHRLQRNAKVPLMCYTSLYIYVCECVARERLNKDACLFEMVWSIFSAKIKQQHTNTRAPSASVWRERLSEQRSGYMMHS